jgi:hypothetical protein
MKDFFRRPKLLKDYYSHADWPWIHDDQEGMSFNPIRPQGCLHYIALFLVFLALLFIAGWVWDFFANLLSVVL